MVILRGLSFNPLAGGLSLFYVIPSRVSRTSAGADNSGFAYHYIILYYVYTDTGTETDTGNTMEPILCSAGALTKGLNLCS